jgi:hypothetical protein
MVSGTTNSAKLRKRISKTLLRTPITRDDFKQGFLMRDVLTSQQRPQVLII